MNLKLAESVFDKASQFLLDYLVATFKEHLPEDLSIVDAALDEALGDLWATLKDVNHHLAYFLYASADHHSRQDLESDLVTDLEAIKLCLLVDVRLGYRAQNLQDEVEEFVAVNIRFKSELHVVLGYLCVDRVGNFTIGGLAVRGHIEVFLLLFVVFDLLASCLLLLDLIFGHDNLDRLFLSALIEEHVAGGAVRVTQAAEIGVRVGLLFVSEGASFELLELPIANSAIVVLHPWVNLCLNPFSVALLFICAPIGVDIGPVVAGIGSS